MTLAATYPLDPDDATAPYSVDWQRVLDNLKAAGVSNNEVARLLGTAQSTVGAWKDGSEPLHRTGEALLALYAKRCPDKLTKLRYPLEPVVA